MQKKLYLATLCGAAIMISGCNLAQDEFETTALEPSSQASLIPEASSQILIEDLAESSSKAAELGLPFPKLTPRASTQLAALKPPESQQEGQKKVAAVEPTVSKPSVESEAKKTRVASLAKNSDALPINDDELFLTEEELRLLEKGEELAKAKSKRKSLLPKAASTVVAGASGAVVKAQAAAFPTIDEILAKAKRGFDLKSYNSFLTANNRVDTSCFPPELRRVLSLVHKKYGKKPSISSGFRSVSYNRRIGGARGSYHTKCQAADIKVAGVNKYVLAKYLRSIPDIGGVGVYGCRGIVHVDVGPRRNWHRPCRKRRRA